MSPSTTRTVTSMRLGLTATAVVMLLASSCATGSNTGTGSAAGTGGPGPTSTGGTTSSPPTTVSILTGRPHPIEHEQRTFVDASRKTPAGKPLGAGTPPAEQPSRTLVTEIYYPAAPGPRPLIMFSHGLSGHPDKFTKLLTVWAKAGYVVVAPAFPLTNDKVPGNPANAFDIWDQPKDISYALDQVLAANTTAGDALHGRIDPNRIGAGGLSLGGATTYGLNFNECCNDRRFIAVEVLSGALLPLSQAYTFDKSLPLLIMHGDNDGSLNYSQAQRAYGLAKPPKYLVTLIGGTHAPPFEDFPSPHDELAEKVTTDFWDVYLAGEKDHLATFEKDAVVPGLSTLEKNV